MTRRIVRTIIQLGAVASTILVLLVLLDNRYRVFPQTIHNHLPTHHPGVVLIDATVHTCSKVNLFSSCRLDPDQWHRIDKDLYLSTSWVSRAYIHIRRRKEEELTVDDKVIVDMRIGRLDPATAEKTEAAEKWEARPAGLWIKRSAKRHDSDGERVITGVDVLFGADAVEPRPGWTMLQTPLLLGSSGEAQEARVSVRRGHGHKIEKPTPRIRKDGKFKILQVADLHLSTGLGTCRDPEPQGHNGGKCDADSRTLEFVGAVLDDEKPDMVVLTGDQVNGETAPDAQTAIFKFAELLITRNIPYAAIFGNHDDEGSLTREQAMAVLETLPYSLSLPGPKSVAGVGNYYIEVLARGSSQHSALTLYFFDTHGYSPDEQHFKGYDWIKPEQIEWFKTTKHELKRGNAQKGYSHIHMDMAFVHIPLPEYADRNNEIVGNWREGVTAPAFNSGLKQALVEEGVLVVSCGHDHVNDYCALSRATGESKSNKEKAKPAGTPELWMCYGGASGFGGYGGYGGYHRRLRVFEIDINEAKISTWKRVEWGEEKGRRLDEQVLVREGKVVSSKS